VGLRHRPIHRAASLVVALVLALLPAGAASARDAPSTGDRYSPIDPATLISTTSVAPDSTFKAGAFRIAHYDIRTLAWDRLPMNGRSLGRLLPAPNSDAEGIPWRVVNGRNYYHPGNIADEGLRFVDSYVRTGVPAYLHKAEIRANKLRALGVMRNGALFIPYPFNWPTEKLQAPWVSAYSQGFALSLFVRLYRVTGDDSYLDSAHAVFRSFHQLGPGSAPWVAYRRNGSLWLEQYPSARPSHVLNGFIFATFGLYDYERLTRDPAAGQLLNGALWTLRHNAGGYRVPGEISLYDLVHRTQHRHYHDVVVWQLRDLSAITRDPYFAGLSNVLETDGD
jgi:D-glucuronyl C5-epimerase C-terminus